MRIIEFIEGNMPDFLHIYNNIFEASGDSPLKDIEIRFFLAILKKHPLSEENIIAISYYLLRENYNDFLKREQKISSLMQSLLDVLLMKNPHSLRAHKVAVEISVIIFQADRVCEMRKKHPLIDESPHAFFSSNSFENIETIECAVEYYFTLARCYYHLNSIEKTKKIYHELYSIITQYMSHMALRFMFEVEIYAMGCDTDRKLIELIVNSIDTQDVYLLLHRDNNEITTENFASYQERVLFITKLLDEKNIPLPQSLAFKTPQERLFLEQFTLALAQQYVMDLSQNNLRVCRAIAQLLIKNKEGLHEVYECSLQKSEKIKIGINISRYKNIEFATAILSLFQRFDRNRFELIFFAGRQWSDDDVLDRFNKIFDKVITYNALNYNDFKYAVRLENLDIFLSENTCLAAASFIFFSRVAPIQINIWDRVVSFGAPYIDYYMTWGSKQLYKQWVDDEKMEHEKYAHLSSAYMAPQMQICTADPYDLQSLGLPEGAQYIFYPQTLRRLMVKDDVVIQKLLRQNPNVYFLGLAASGERTQTYYYRWAQKMPELMDRIRFLPRVAPTQYLWVVQHAACILGSFQGSHGGITNPTVFSQGQPIVAGYGPTFSGNLTKYHYEIMGIEGLIANSHDEAVEICQRLLDDPDWKAQKSLEIKNNYHKLSNLKDAAKEMQDFLIQAYERALAGKAPEHWDHGMFEDDPRYVGARDDV